MASERESVFAFRYRLAVWRASVRDFFWRLRRTGVYRSDGVRVMLNWWFLGVDPYEECEPEENY